MLGTEEQGLGVRHLANSKVSPVRGQGHSVLSPLHTATQSIAHRDQSDVSRDKHRPGTGVLCRQTPQGLLPSRATPAPPLVCPRVARAA